jgi:hypothetical protein
MSMPLTAGSYCPHASETKDAAMKEHEVLLAFILSTYWMRNALEEDWQGSPFAGWADKQEVLPTARERLSGQVKCCNQAEIVKTQFPVSRAHENRRFYLTKENKWKRKPPDIIHLLEEDTPTHQLVLFIWADKEVCFWVGGIDG